MNDAITYSGATYIGSRSAKHSESSAFAHLQDMKSIRSLPEFTSSFQIDRLEEKKIILVTVDSDPDENPRYEKTINYSIVYFFEHDLDAFFGNKCLRPKCIQSRRMIKLSKA